jgi:hypothetical protein
MDAPRSSMLTFARRPVNRSYGVPPCKGRNHRTLVSFCKFNSTVRGQSYFSSLLFFFVTTTISRIPVSSLGVNRTLGPPFFSPFQETFLVAWTSRTKGSTLDIFEQLLSAVSSPLIGWQRKQGENIVAHNVHHRPIPSLSFTSLRSPPLKRVQQPSAPVSASPFNSKHKTLARIARDRGAHAGVLPFPSAPILT